MTIIPSNLKLLICITNIGIKIILFVRLMHMDETPSDTSNFNNQNKIPSTTIGFLTSQTNKNNNKITIISTMILTPKINLLSYATQYIHFFVFTPNRKKIR